MRKKALDEINRHNDEMSVAASADRFNRARSLTVGTTFNGGVEVVLRTDEKHVWALLSPPEVIELVNQLAASVGCHILVQPRNDFATYRNWGDSLPNMISVFPTHGMNSPDPLLGVREQVKEVQYEEAVAVEAPKQRRKSKRTPASA